MMDDAVPQYMLRAQLEEDRLAKVQTACHSIWDSPNARFTQCALPLLSAIPLAVALCIITPQLLCLVPLIRRYRPQWTKPFIQEESKEESDLPAKPKRPRLGWPAALLALSIVAIAAQAVKLSFRSLLMHGILLLLSWVSIMVYVGIARPRSCPKVLFVYYAVAILSELPYVDLQSAPRSVLAVAHYASGLAALLSLAVLLFMPYRKADLDNEGISAVGSVPDNTLRSPEDNLRPWQFLTASWVAPLISLAVKRQLNEEDVWLLGYEFQHTRLYDTFRQLSGSVLGRLLQANGIDCSILAIFALAELVCDFANPLLLQQLLRAMEGPSPLRSVALTYAVITVLVNLANAQISLLALWYGRRCYERSRGEMIMMVYDKALSRKSVIGTTETSSGNGAATEGAEESAKKGKPRSELYRLLIEALWGRKESDVEKKQPASTGKIFNLIRGDVYDVAQRFWEIESLIKTPVGLILAIVLVWKVLGPSCFLGVVVLVLGQGINLVLTRILVRWRKVMKAAIDARLQINSEYIEVLRHLRWYGWHNHWLKKVLSARQTELNTRAIAMVFNSGVYIVNSAINGVFPVAAFYGYTVLAGHPLRTDIIFPALSLFMMLQSRITEIPRMINTLLNAYVALKRIEDFMAEPEMSPLLDTPVPTLRLDDCSFAWPGTDKMILEDVNLDIPQGLTVIYGKVGSGKTALLQSILGELDLKSGSLEIPNEMVGYCSQTPWLQSMSIRDNILFFAPFEEERYWKVLEACALLPDLANFKDNDRSLIGENGIGLSGGQKARVALARAIYSRAKILLLDDPLSALDHNTAEIIVDKCLTGPLVKDRRVVLVTHRTSLVRNVASYFVEIADGTAKPSRSTRTIDETVSGEESAPDDAELAPKDDKDAPDAKKFMEDEHRSHGDVKLSVYWTYLKAGDLRLWAVSLVALTLVRAMSVARNWFVKSWGEAYEESKVTINNAPAGLYTILTTPIPGSNATIHPLDWLKPIDYLPNPLDDVRPWLLGLLMISLVQSAIMLLSEIVELAIVYQAAKRMFARAMDRITNSTFRFYDVTPVGRLMNRLTSDMGTVDGTLGNFYILIFYGVTWIISFLVIATVTPLFFLFSLALMGIFVYIFNRFLPGSQSLRRLETTSLSPLFANFGELLQGLTTVRAFQAQKLFQERIIRVVDNFQGMDHFYWSLQSWITYRFEAISALATFLLTVIALYTQLSAGLIAFMLLTASNFVTATHAMCRLYGELQMSFISVERVIELLDLEQEPPGSIKPPASWPKLGADVVFENVTVRYAEDLDPSLMDISLRIPGGSTTAIIGRTGSGKSTLASSLLNIVRPDNGGISIDGISLSEVDTVTLRHRVTYIAQDPVLFSGTIRHNLDPVHDFSDEECALVLNRICARHGWTLDTNVEAGGRNLSQGQRQLIGITRAVLRRSPLIILDEATASIDFETSMEIQEVLRSEMQESTVITIAHRVEAVKDADYCVVLEKGRVLRQGPVNDTKSGDEN